MSEWGSERVSEWVFVHVAVVCNSPQSAVIVVVDLTKNQLLLVLLLSSDLVFSFSRCMGGYVCGTVWLLFLLLSNDHQWRWHSMLAVDFFSHTIPATAIMTTTTTTSKFSSEFVFIYWLVPFFCYSGCCRALLYDFLQCLREASQLSS